MPSETDAFLPSGRLEERFAEVHPRYSEGDAAAEAARCLYCFDAPCMKACPTHIDVSSFIRKIASGNLKGSARTILEANLLGASCAKVCPVEVLCEGACVYVGWGRHPISIGRLQRFAMEKGASSDLLAKAPPSGRSVGLVGAGPASLACAGTLALLGHEAVIYERHSLPGGLNTSGVAPYKMPVAGALEEVEFIRELGVKILTGVEVGRDITGGELLLRHEAVFLGVGLGPDTPLAAPGAQGPGVIGAVEWIRRMKLDPRASVAGVHRAAVIGGGNTALDAARELALLGVPDVKLVYRRSEAEMPGYRHEWAAARTGGVALIQDALVKEVVRVRTKEGSAPGPLEKLRLSRAKNGQPTNSEIAAIPVDLVVVAIGQAKLAALAKLFYGVAVDDSGCFRTDPGTCRTGNPRVFAGGDAANGSQEVVHAAADGQAAAHAIDAMLRDPTMRRSRESNAESEADPATFEGT